MYLFYVEMMMRQEIIIDICFSSLHFINKKDTKQDLHIYILSKRVCQFFDCAAVTANGNWYYVSALESMGAKHCSRYSFINIALIYKHVKREKV